MPNVTQLNVIDIIIDTPANLPPAQGVIGQGTLAFAKSTGALYVLVIDPATNIHTWQPVTSFAGESPVNYKFAGGLAVADTAAHTRSLADDGELDAQASAALVYRVVSTTTSIRVRANVLTNTSDTAAHLNILRNGSIVQTILITAGFTGGLNLDATQAFADGNGLEAQIVKDAGGAGGAQVIQLTANVYLFD